METMNKRVLGRILAVEEIVAVSGARPTSTVYDNGTFPPRDTGYAMDIIPVDAKDVSMPSLHAETP
jgi:hypothetical protein